MKIHLVYPSHFIELKEALEDISHQVVEWDYTLEQFAIFSNQHKMSADVVLIDGTAGIHHKQSSFEYLRNIRKNLPETRLIVVYPEYMKHDQKWLNQIIGLAIFDVYFTDEFGIDDVENWLHTKKTIADHLSSDVNQEKQQLFEPMEHRPDFRPEPEPETSFVEKVKEKGKQVKENITFITSKTKLPQEANKSENQNHRKKQAQKEPKYLTRRIGICSPVPSGKTFVIYHLIQQLEGLSVAAVDAKKSLSYLTDQVPVYDEEPPFGQYEILLIESSQVKQEILQQMDAIILVVSPYPHHIRRVEQVIQRYSHTGNPLYVVMNQWDEDLPISSKSLLQVDVDATIPFERKWLSASWSKENISYTWIQDLERLWFQIIQGGYASDII